MPGFAREFGFGFTSPTGIGVRVRKDHNLDVVKTWIGSFGDGSAGIREKPHTSGIFKQKRAIISAKLPGVTAQRRNFHDRRNIGGSQSLSHYLPLPSGARHGRPGFSRACSTLRPVVQAGRHGEARL
jgi:hypothetical protein